MRVLRGPSCVPPPRGGLYPYPGSPDFLLSVVMSHFLRLSLILSCAAASAFAQQSQPIDALVAEISADHPELRLLEAELAAVRADARAVTSAPAELSVDYGRKRVRTAGGELAGEGHVWSVSLSRTLDWQGRTALRRAIAARDVELAEAGLERFRRELATRAAELAFGLHAAQTKALAAREVADRHAALVAVFLARESGGPTPELETRALEARALVLERRATIAELAVDAALVELNQLRGRPPSSSVTVVSVSPAFAEAPAHEVLLASARDNNFEFRSRRVELERQGDLVRLARRERLPELTLSPFVERESGDGTETTVGIGLSLPLSGGRAPTAVVAASEARRLQAEAALRAADLQLEREVLLTARTYAAHRAEMQRWSSDTVGRLRAAPADADRHYRLGAVPLGTYLELQDAYLEAVEALLDTEAEALAAGLRLQLLTGLDFGAVRLAP